MDKHIISLLSVILEEHILKIEKVIILDMEVFIQIFTEIGIWLEI